MRSLLLIMEQFDPAIRRRLYSMFRHTDGEAAVCQGPGNRLAMYMKIVENHNGYTSQRRRNREGIDLLYLSASHEIVDAAQAV